MPDRTRRRFNAIVSVARHDHDRVMMFELKGQLALHGQAIAQPWAMSKRPITASEGANLGFRELIPGLAQPGETFEGEDGSTWTCVFHEIIPARLRHEEDVAFFVAVPEDDTRRVVRHRAKSPETLERIERWIRFGEPHPGRAVG